VAIKIISLDELKSKRLEELVFEEIRILQLMHHPNILKFHEALLSDRNCYIVTEICNQGDLEDRIKKKRTFSDAELSKVLLDIYLGLRYLKEMGVTHRDLKPANIFMHNGQAKIADFGLAKLYKFIWLNIDKALKIWTSDLRPTCLRKA
jgi:serine/threonine protein kinase